MKKLIVTDFDRTLSRGYISMEFMDFLFVNLLYDAESYQRQQKALLDYHDKTINYDWWCDIWGKLWAEGMKGQKASDIDTAAQDFFRTFKKNIYPSSYKLIDHLKKDHDILCLSVGASEVISLAAKDLGVNDSISTCLEREEIYTGDLLTDLHLPQGKEKFLRELGFPI